MDDFHPAVLAAIPYLATPEKGLQHFADKLGISKQALHKQVKKVSGHLEAFGKPASVDPALLELQAEVNRLNALVAKLRRQLIIANTIIYLLKCFKERIIEFFPKYEVKRFKPWEKKYIIDMMLRFTRSGGAIKEFCQAIGKSPQTITNWQKRYEQHGMSGLADKTTRPKHFSKRIPLWVRDQLLALFIRFPQWKTWQYYKYMAYNPAIQWHVSLPVIDKMKRIHIQRREDEMDRIKKRWCFEPGTAVWTIDFTTILKTGRYHLRLLTVSDHASRFFFEPALFIEASTDQVIEHLENLFLKYGKPYFIKADNGPEFRLDCREKLKDFSVNLLNSPMYYGQFNAAHERLHRTLKGNIDKLSTHQDLFRLTHDIDKARDDLNHHSRLDCLNGKTPFEVFFGEEDFIPNDVEVIKPYVKDGELRMKFSDRLGKPARIAIPAIADEESTAEKT